MTDSVPIMRLSIQVSLYGIISLFVIIVVLKKEKK